MILTKASLNDGLRFIVLATVITIVNYDRKTFIVQATECSMANIESLEEFKTINNIMI
jgi:hypothetical protein